MVEGPDNGMVVKFDVEPDFLFEYVNTSTKNLFLIYKSVLSEKQGSIELPQI